MKSTRNLSMTIGLAILLLLGFGGASASAAVYDLCVDEGAITMPDNASVPVWGFGEADGLGNCVISVPGPELTVPAGDSTLQINLTNNLGEPVSLHILGQTLSNNGGPVFTTPTTGYDANLSRVMSFSHEAEANGGSATYIWNNFRPGTYLLQSGTNPAKQVQMGLYTVVKKDQAAGSAYAGQPYDIEATVVFHDIDPEIHQAIVDGRYGANPTSATGPYISSSVYREPRYFLINGAAYPNTDTNPVLPSVGAGQRVLLRFVNAGLMTHVPQIPSHYLTLIAEDGNPYAYPRQSYGFELAPAKTMDVIFESAVEGAFAVYDGRLKLTNAGAADMGGMLAFLTVGAGSGTLNPVAVADAYATSVDTPLTVAAPGVLGNDDPRGAAGMIAVLDATTANGILDLNDDGSFSYTPNTGFTGGDSFTYYAQGLDTNGTVIGTSNTVSVSLIVSAGNTAPVAGADSYATNAGTALSVPPAEGVLSNDTDADEDTLTAVLQSSPAKGVLAFNANGSFVYTPNAGSFGPDSFTYVANDGTADSNPATVTIDVNGAPVAADDPGFVTDENVPLTVGAAEGVLANDSDPDGDSLSAILVDPPGQGFVTLNTDGSFTYEPGNNFSGTDSFTYRASDGSAQSNIATATITVTNVSDTVSIVSVQYTNNGRKVLVVRADSSAPDNSVVLTATITSTEGESITGTLDYNPDPDRQDYSADFRLPNRFVPNLVTVTSSQGGSDSAAGPFPVAD